MLNYKELRRNGEFNTVSPYKMPSPWATMAVVTLLLIMASCTLAHAKTPPLTDNNAILSIIGEGENQGYTGMLALAGAIRNRGTLKGVYGVKAPRVVKRKYSNATYNMAKKAWVESLKVDITKGADHWENIKAFGTPYWAKSMVKTFEHKDHVFYMAKGE